MNEKIRHQWIGSNNVNYRVLQSGIDIILQYRRNKHGKLEDWKELKMPAPAKEMLQHLELLNQRLNAEVVSLRGQVKRERSGW